jgi:hypothetical protein
MVEDQRPFQRALGGVGVWRRLLVSTSVENPREVYVFFNPLEFSMQSV